VTKKVVGVFIAFVAPLRPELADNVAIHKLWKHFNPVINCRRKTFRKEI
jgi:hypothetical protein